jgi:hypothetical protein
MTADALIEAEAGKNVFVEPRLVDRADQLALNELVAWLRARIRKR